MKKDKNWIILKAYEANQMKGTNSEKKVKPLVTAVSE